MRRPVTIATVDCHHCTPWVRWVRSGSGAWVAQTKHENHCDVYPHVQRKGNS